jgi:FAD/FMN-containing dehydrogenase
VKPHESKLARLRAELAAGGPGGIGLAKSTSNLFRDRERQARPRVDLSGFNEVIEVDAARSRVSAEGMTTYSDLVDATLAQGVMPCVVPELKSITLGGAAAGVGIEASSFRYGLVHDTLLALDVLLADGSIVTCTPENEHRDLFYGFPNSYGTLGYALKVTARTVPVKPYVRVQHVRHTNAESFFDDLQARCKTDVDFVDGTVFSASEMYLTLGRFSDGAPYTSDYTYERIYYRSIRERTEDYLTVHDYIWRWDTDWFWCSKNLFVQNPLVRRLVGRNRLNSTAYTKLMRLNSRVGLTTLLFRLAGKSPESVIQDVDLPLGRCAEFLAFLLREVGVLPIWICPIGVYDPKARFPLYPLDPGSLHVNFGFWDVVKDLVRHEPGYYNRKIERKVAEMGGVKSLYSDSFYPEDEFWRLYNKTAYDALKRRYDPGGRFKNLYEKCVLRS